LSDGSSELNEDQRLNHFGATQFTPELGSNSDLTWVQSWTTLVQRTLNLSADLSILQCYGSSWQPNGLS